MLAMPVAAMGWPFDCRPPDTFTGSRPFAPRCARLEEVDGTTGLAEHQVVVVHELGRGEAVVQLDEVEILGAHAGLLVRLLAALRVSVLTSGSTWQASCHGSLVGTLARTLTAHFCCSAESVFSFSPVTTTAAAAPSQLAEHIGRVFGRRSSRRP